ncbi:leukocyte immunoglobulin-like receptor subfamily B member 4A [Acomys russatus]|uniref:leukocyte immunoglobulin-like receptor subfamily B member 4A n=1 Tax=Acomys russatus TaxID=60746 RepID=UPI0021E347FD|nr:leukocyte immunoglobulin-like receptor subfamily B member 4A [Acomys russatus]
MGSEGGMSWDSHFDFLSGPLPKPIIWAEPGPVIATYSSVVIWCQGSWEAQEYLLHKKRSIDPWDRQLPLESMNKAKFRIDHMADIYADIYTCYYRSSSGLSEHSDILELVMTGAYEKPSLSVWPSFDVISGESIIMKCSSSLGFGRFILMHKGKHNLSWTLDSQKHSNQPSEALFPLDSVTHKHNGTFRCYGYFRNQPQVWSKSSNPLELLVSESKDQSPTTTQNGLGKYQKVLIGVLVSFLLIFFLLILLILFRHKYKGKNKKPDASAKDTPPEDSEELDSWIPPDEEPQRIVYAQDTTTNEPQHVTYAQVCSRTREMTITGTSKQPSQEEDTDPTFY